MALLVRTPWQQPADPSVDSTAPVEHALMAPNTLPRRRQAPSAITPPQPDAALRANLCGCISPFPKKKKTPSA